MRLQNKTKTRTDRPTEIVGGIYYIQNTVSKNIKIGHWFGLNPEHRLRSLQTGNDAVLEQVGAEFIFSKPPTDRESADRVRDSVRALESKRHVRFAESRLRGEWFVPTARLKQFIGGLDRINELDRNLTVLQEAKNKT